MQPLQRSAIAAYAPISKAAKASECVKTFYLLLKTSFATPIECATRDPAKASHFHSRGLSRQREGSGSTTFLALGFAFFSLEILPRKPRHRTRARWE
jgi:hypothetical protein